MKKKNIIFTIIVILLIGVILGYLLFRDMINNKEKIGIELKDTYRIENNNLSDFDLVFFTLENNTKNKIYSPLSIKYALSMLNEGANGKSKEQINNVLGDYILHKYSNNQNMSLANAMFIKDSFKNNVKKDYANIIKEKYDAEIIYDNFKKPDTINNWVSNKTFKLINNLFDNVFDKDYILVNALAIDMEWINKIQSENENFKIEFTHEKFSSFLPSLLSSGYHKLPFNNLNYDAKSIAIEAVANRYDIINILGEDNIREIVSQKYQEWLKEGATGACKDISQLEDIKTFTDNYIKDISTNYGYIGSSTDFKYFIDDNIKVFSKELKKYDNTTLEYIGIMPINKDLNSYINSIDINDLSRLINNLNSIELNYFKDGVITEIKGYIPLFKFDYELDLKDDLIRLGISDVFDIRKSNLSNLTIGSSVISEAKHKANIEFSNAGIKASAVTSLGGVNSVAKICGFDYQFDVPVETIDLTFNKPYLFIIRNKYSGEVWLTGTVYEPDKYAN